MVSLQQYLVAQRSTRQTILGDRVGRAMIYKDEYSYTPVLIHVLYRCLCPSVCAPVPDQRHTAANHGSSAKLEWDTREHDQATGSTTITVTAQCQACHPN